MSTDSKSPPISRESSRSSQESKPIETSPATTETHNHTTLQNFIHTTTEETNPSFRHLASHSSLQSIKSNQSRGSSAKNSNYYSASDYRSTRTKASSFRPLSTTFEEQRYESRSGISLMKNTKIFEPNPPSKVSLRSDSTYDGVYGSRNVQSSIGSVASIVAGDSKGKPVPSPDVNAEITASEVKEEEDEMIYPKPLPLAILVTGIALSVFLISLDRTIITTAIPFITNQFQSYADIGWYGSGYLLTASAFQPLYGRIFMLFNMKWSYLVALGMFELGSLICGVAPSSATLIVGRAIAGLGSAGILTGSFVVVSHAVPLQQRPVLTAVVGLMFGVGATAGPLLGGVFTDLVTWRWCFYFNLPVGGVTAGAMILFFHPPKKHALMGKSFFYRVMELDLIGNVLLLGAAVMLFLALQNTEEQVPWGSAEVVGLLVGCGVTLIIFCVWQWWKADGALMPPRILGQRSVAASCAAAFCMYSAVLIHTYYLPMWFQAVKNDSAIDSGVNMIPYVVANAVFTLLAGVFVSKKGYFTAPAIFGCAIGTVGYGLLSTIGENTSTAKWVGYEILVSAGIGMAIQQGFTAVQIVLPLEEVAIGTAAIVAFQSLGGAIFVSVGNTILQNSLLASNIPGVDMEAVIDAGASHFRNVIPPEHVQELVNVYANAFRRTLTAATPMAGLAMICCLFLEWRNVNDKKKGEDEEKAKRRILRGGIGKRIIEASKNGHRRSSTLSSHRSGQPLTTLKADGF